MAFDYISQVSDILRYPVVIGNNINITISQALTILSKQGMHVEKAKLWIILRKFWYQIYKIQIL